MFRVSPDEVAAVGSGILGWQEARQALEALSGARSRLSEEKHESAQSRASCLSLSAPRCRYSPAEPSLEYGYHLHSTWERVCLFGSGGGLAQPVRHCLETVEHADGGFLRGVSRRCFAIWQA